MRKMTTHQKCKVDESYKWLILYFVSILILKNILYSAWQEVMNSSDLMGYYSEAVGQKLIGINENKTNTLSPNFFFWTDEHSNDYKTSDLETLDSFCSRVIQTNSNCFVLWIIMFPHSIELISLWWTTFSLIYEHAVRNERTNKNPNNQLTFIHPRPRYKFAFKKIYEGYLYIINC